MKKWLNYLLYELKKNLWTLVILTAVFTISYVSSVSSMEMSYTWELDGETYFQVADPQLSSVFVMLGALCYIVPALVYSFKMNKRSVDAYYSLPLKREKLYLAKAVLGFALVVIPFTVAYWLGFLSLVVREGNPYQMEYYLPAYFGALLYGLSMFGVNSFVFTRANKTSDGVVFMIAYTFIVTLLVSWLRLANILDLQYFETSVFNTFGGFDMFGSLMSAKIMGEDYTRWSSLMWIVPTVYGLACWFLFVWCVRYEKGENAEQVSDSWYGYKVLIPLYIALWLAHDYIDPWTICAALVAAVVATIVFQRKFRFSWKWWVMIGGAIALGLILHAFLP